MSAIEVSLPFGGALFTTRAGGVSQGPYESLNLGPWTDDDEDAVAENRARLERRVGRTLAHARQLHGTSVSVWGEGTDPAAVPSADAHVTARTDLAPLVLTADCLPIALATESAVAIVHAGWRGIVDGVIESAIARLRGLGAEGDTLHAVIGPGAGACCYEVAGEAAERLAPHLTGANADLKAAAGKRLADAGADSIRDLGICTICDERFFSHRRSGGITGRQAGVVWRA